MTSGGGVELLSTKLVTGVLRKTSEDKVGPASTAQIKVVLQNCQQSEPPRLQKGRKGSFQLKVHSWKGSPHSGLHLRLQELCSALRNLSSGVRRRKRATVLLKGTWLGCSYAKDTPVNHGGHNQTGHLRSSWRGGSGMGYGLRVF